jgi:hypothetical protein
MTRPEPPAERSTLRRHRELADLARAAAVADERILAAWLVGSLTTGHADAYSDIDFHVLVAPEDYSAYSSDGWKEFVASFSDTVMMRPFQSGGGGYAITSDWMHFDIAIHSGQPMLRPGSGLIPLFDRLGRLPAAAHQVDIERGDPWFPADVVQWFFYMLGNLAVVVGRDEPVLGTNGAIMLRDTCLVPLMHAETGTIRTGGDKRLRVFLTDEQHSVLESLPEVAPTLDSVVDAYAAAAEVFVSRGRALAERFNGDWPVDFERATADHLERMVGRRIPTEAH